jgi:hypothetical protein
MWDRVEEIDCDDGVCSEDTKNGEVRRPARLD